MFIKKALGNKYIFKFSKLTRSISAIALTAFMVVLCRDYSIAQPIGAPLPLFIPQDIGTITQTFTGKGENLVVFINDLHCQKEAQENITRIIKTTKDYYGNDFKLVGVEGDQGAIDTSILGVIPNRKVKQKVLEYFMERGQVTGAEAYDVLYPGSVELFGLENKTIYDEDFLLLFKSLYYRNDAEAIISGITPAMDYGKTLLYPSKLLKFEEREREYKEHKISLHAFLLFIRDTALQENIDLSRGYQNIFNFLKAREMSRNLEPAVIAVESEAVISRIKDIVTEKEYLQLKKLAPSQTEAYYAFLKNVLKRHKVDIGEGYPGLKKYFAYTDYLENVSYELLFEEMEHIRFKIKQKIVEKRKDAKQLVYCEYYMSLMQDYFNNAVSFKDMADWQGNKNEFYGFMEDINGRLALKNQFKDSREILNEAEDNMQRFYKLADKRSDIMVSNLLKEARNKKAHVSAAVIGGYHTEEVAGILRSKGVSYIVVSPSISGAADRRIYEDRLHLQARVAGINTITVAGKTITPGMEAKALNPSTLFGALWQAMLGRTLVEYLAEDTPRAQILADINAMNLDISFAVEEEQVVFTVKTPQGKTFTVKNAGIEGIESSFWEWSEISDPRIAELKNQLDSLLKGYMENKVPALRLRGGA
ncbi:MAG: hypothetical protein ABH857_01735, partial [Elusimicrobiota bacterium]